MTDVVIIIIGYNEGRLLQKSLSSSLNAVRLAQKNSLSVEVVYVDSHSTDNSVSKAKDHGIKVAYTHPDYKTPANARNAGIFLTNSEFVMFLDGDMEISADWLPHGVEFLRKDPKAAGVAGVRDDKRLSGDVFNLIPNYYKTVEMVEPVKADVGGAFLYRRSALEQIGGFEAELLVGEESVLCCRLILGGWRLYRIRHPMITHWDVKASSPFKLLARFFDSGMVPGVVFRYAIANSNWGSRYLFQSQFRLVVHIAWIGSLLGMVYLVNIGALLVGSTLFVLSSVIYACQIYAEKGDVKRTGGAFFLRTLYFIGFLFGFVFNYPKISFGVQNTRAYVNSIRDLNVHSF